MANYQKINKEAEFLQNIQKYEQPEPSKHSPFELSRTGGGCDDTDTNNTNESLQERLYGLTEMFPQPIRSALFKTTKALNTFLKRAYKFACNFSWFAFSTAIILFAPVIIEYELNNKN